MLKKKIKLQVHCIPIPYQPIYRKYAQKFNFEIDNAKKFYNREFSIPIYFDLKKDFLYSQLN